VSCLNSYYKRTLTQTGLFSANLDTDALNALRADPEVASIEEDGIMHALATVTQTDAVLLINLFSNLQLTPIPTLALGSQPCLSG
jgi:hypothetical protein